MKDQIPLEIIERILELLADWAGNPSLAFRIATILQWPHLRVRLVHLTGTIDRASGMGLVSVLDLFLESILASRNAPDQIPARTELLIYTDAAINNASRNGHTDVLRWWMGSGLPLNGGKTAGSIFSLAHLQWTGQAKTAMRTSSSGGKTSGLKHHGSSEISFLLASRNGHVPVLDWWKNSGYLLSWDNKPMSYASQNGHVDVLQWWKDSGLELKYDYGAMTNASVYGQIDVLQWWKDSGLPNEYQDRILNVASKLGNVDVLEWWKNSGLKLVWDTSAVLELGHLEVLEWWNASGLDLKYDANAMNSVSANGRVDVLQWWKDSGLEPKYDEAALDNASAKNHIAVLQWWKDSCLEIKWTESAMDTASIKGHIETLEWWKHSGLELKWTHHAMNFASINWHIGVLQWWKDSGLELKWTDMAMDYATTAKHVAVLQWWKDSGLELKWTNRRMFDAVPEHDHLTKDLTYPPEETEVASDNAATKAAKAVLQAKRKTNWDAKVLDTRSKLFLKLADNQLIYVHETKTATDIWDKLKSAHIQCNPSLQQHISDMMMLVQQLHAAGKTISTEEYIL
ncbi:hypothetical protein BJ742DRAFT_860228 [Cladochytrium replicatum]|nr:hypothetical protein BJ742DRAFT_860228 [Cladochytrium replicatum]